MQRGTLIRTSQPVTAWRNARRNRIEVSPFGIHIPRLAPLIQRVILTVNHSRRLRSRRRTRISTQLELLEVRRVLDSTVVFNEVMYNSASGDESLEWIELHNQMSVDMNLSGWTLGDAVDYQFPQGTILEGGKYLVVAASPAALEASQGYAGAMGPYSRQLANRGDRIELRNHTGRLMDVLEYGDDGDWPVAADGSGASLAKMSPQMGSQAADELDL